MKMILRGNRWILNGCNPLEDLKSHKYIVTRKGCDDRIFTEAHEWCYANVKGTFAARVIGYGYYDVEYYFENKDEAMMFKLMFGGDL